MQPLKNGSDLGVCRQFEGRGNMKGRMSYANPRQKATEPQSPPTEPQSMKRPQSHRATELVPADRQCKK